MLFLCLAVFASGGCGGNNNGDEPATDAESAKDKKQNGDDKQKQALKAIEQLGGEVLLPAPT